MLIHGSAGHVGIDEECVPGSDRRTDAAGGTNMKSIVWYMFYIHDFINEQKN